MEMNFDEMKESLKEAANSPVPSSTLDVLSIIKGFENIRNAIRVTLNELGGVCQEILESDAPNVYKKEIVYKLDLLRRIDAQYCDVINSLKGLLPLMQKLDIAGVEARERAKEFLKEMGDE